MRMAAWDGEVSPRYFRRLVAVLIRPGRYRRRLLMLSAARRDEILQCLQQRRTASVAELSVLCQVSEVTIRQDLKRLAQDGLLVRTRGGAYLSIRANHELSFAARQELNADQKRRIGEVAASLIRSGDSVILDASTTALQVLKALKNRTGLRDVTVITNGIFTALEVLDRPDITAILTGGMLRATATSLTGLTGQQMLSHINGLKGFLGAKGITLENGLTDANIQEVQTKMALVERCQEVTAVLDASKFGVVSLATFAPAALLRRIITDRDAPSEAVAAFRAQGIEVLLA
jgi:DeoR/GlpR family transcriptional regulator of sugar metabolism